MCVCAVNKSICNQSWAGLDSLMAKWVMEICRFPSRCIHYSMSSNNQQRLSTVPIHRSSKLKFNYLVLFTLELLLHIYVCACVALFEEGFSSSFNPFSLYLVDDAECCGYPFLPLHIVLVSVHKYESWLSILINILIFFSIVLQSFSLQSFFLISIATQNFIYELVLNVTVSLNLCVCVR